MKHKILKYILIFLTFVSSFFSWLFLHWAIGATGSKGWIVPLILFSSFYLIICFDIILFRRDKILKIILALSLSFSFFFSFYFWHIAVFILAALLVFIAQKNIGDDLGLNIKVDLRKSIITGRIFLIIALGLLISSQFFFEAQKKGIDTVPRFNLGGVIGIATPGILKMVNPEFKNIDSKNLSVDEFLLEIEKNNSFEAMVSGENEIDGLIGSQYESDLSFQEKEILKNQITQDFKKNQDAISEKSRQLLLEEGRLKLSELSGKSVAGEEKIADVFSDIVNNKINDYFNPVASDGAAVPFIPLVLAAALFLTILPLGSILGKILIFPIKIIFSLLIRFGFVSIEKEMKEVEVVVL